MGISFNSFTGKIPPTLENLRQLYVLNLQKNATSGAIPSLNLPRLKILNFSYNNLNGSIPSSLQKFPYSSFVGNSLLCGLPLKNCSSMSSSPAPSPVYFPTPTIQLFPHIDMLLAIALLDPFLCGEIQIYLIKKPNLLYS